MKETVKEKKKRGRSEIPDIEKVSAITFYARKKNHEAIRTKVEPIIKKMDK